MQRFVMISRHLAHLLNSNGFDRTNPERELAADLDGSFLGVSLRGL
jgi:hypothetical protein